MSADLFDDALIEVAGVTQEVTSDVIGMLDTREDILGVDGKLRALPELGAGVLALKVDVVHPAVVVGSGGMSDVLLEHDDVVIWHGLGVGNRQEGGNALMDGLGAQGRGRRCQQRQEGDTDEGTHDGWRGGWKAGSDKGSWSSTCDDLNERGARFRGTGRERWR